MRVRTAFAVLLLSAGLFAQSATPAQTASSSSAVSVPCPSDRPVDDLIAEIHKQQSKKKNRNPNPMPDIGCVFGWCRQTTKTPRTLPEPAPKAEPSREQNATPGVSSSAANACDAAMERSLSAAHDVEVGDYYFDQNNSRAAMFRYKDAADQKQGDAAIYVRMGRALEKLKDVPGAVQQYKKALEGATSATPSAALVKPEEASNGAAENRWVQEARAALARLQR